MNRALQIACQQVLMEDASVFSVQWMTLPGEYADRLSPGLLLDRYLSHIRRSTLTLVRPVKIREGVEFRLWRSGKSLLRFSSTATGESDCPQTLALRICGGLLVQRENCDRGELVFSCEREPEGVKVGLRLSDYCPLLLGGPAPNRLRKLLYRWTQAALHKLVTVRFLRRIYREMAGPKACCRVVRVQVRAGEEI